MIIYINFNYWSDDMKTKHITALILIIVLVFNSLTACNTKKDLYSKAQFTNVYKIKYLEIPDGYTAHTPYFVDDKIYINYYKMEFNDNGYTENDNVVYIYDTYGDLIEINDLNFEGFEGIPCYFVPSNDGAFYIIDTNKIHKITNDGTLIWEVNFGEAFNIRTGWSSSTKYSFCFDENYLYILGNRYTNNQLFSIIYALTHSGEAIQNFEIEGESNQLFKSHDGEILLKCYNKNIHSGGSRYNYYAVNMKSGKLDEYSLPKLPNTFTNYIYSSGEVCYGSSFADDYEIYYKDNSGLYGYDSDTKKSELLVNWTNSDLLGQYCTVLSVITPDVLLCELEDFYSQSRWYAKTPKSLALLTRISDDEAAQKTILTISTTSSVQSVLMQTVVMFNRQSDKYRVVIDDYSAYNTGDNLRGTEIFDFDIASGVVHDMNFIFNNPEKYLNKGMFADLYEFFDSDPDISRDHLLGVIRRNNETDGHLYMIPSYFTIYTLIGKPSMVGANETLTIDEVIKLNENLPPNTTLFTNCGRDDIFRMIIRTGTSKYIDYKTAKCNFTDSSFIKMIEFVKTLPDNIGNGWYFVDSANEEAIEKVRNDNSYLLEFAFYNIESFINLKYIYGDEDYVIKGYPSEMGNGSNIMDSDFITINSKSPNKEGAWEFIKFYLSDEVQLYQSTLPITNSALSYILDDYLNKYFYTIKNSTNPGAIQILDEPIEQWRRDTFNDFSFTEKDAAEIKRFLNDVPVVPKYDTTVFEIIYEEISAFFAEAITAEQCAKYIQNRVGTYLNEQK